MTLDGFKFQSDSINTNAIEAVYFINPPLNSNLILLILEEIQPGQNELIL